MRDSARTTIVLPRETLRRAKVASARADRTLSQFITEALERALGTPDEPPVSPLPIGKYELHIDLQPRRREIYAQALRGEVSA